MDKAHPQSKGQSALSKPINLNVNLIKKSFIETSNIMFEQVSRYYDPDKLTHRINHYRYFCEAGHVIKLWS